MGLEGNPGDGEDTQCDNAPIQCDNRNAKWAGKKIPRGISHLESPEIRIEP